LSGEVPGRRAVQSSRPLFSISRENTEFSLPRQPPAPTSAPTLLTGGFSFLPHSPLACSISSQRNAEIGKTISFPD